MDDDDGEQAIKAERRAIARQTMILAGAAGSGIGSLYGIAYGRTDRFALAIKSGFGGAASALLYYGFYLTARQREHSLLRSHVMAGAATGFSVFGSVLGSFPRAVMFGIPFGAGAGAALHTGINYMQTRRSAPAPDASARPAGPAFQMNIRPMTDAERQERQDQQLKRTSTATATAVPSINTPPASPNSKPPSGSAVS